MKLLIQVVKEAQVSVHGTIVGSIQQGLLIFFGAHAQDTQKECGKMAEKLSTLRIFPDAQGKMNLSIKDTGGSVLIVSQFTLYADCTQGRRPSFTEAAPPPYAKELYENFVHEMKSRVQHVETGSFGAHMEVALINNGPLTFILS